jgi:NAD(P)-dependent dehydrogenase (short-subunit alcohol dehydrogenase family)
MSGARPLAGQRAVVTGGARGIGLAIARALAAEGATVTITGRDPVRLDRAAGEIGAKALRLDVTQPDEVARAFGAAGAVDILVNNAGAAESAPFARTDLDLWQRMIAVNLTGAYLCCRAVLPDMTRRGAGRVVMIASTAGLTGYAYVSAYCAAKHGVIGLMRSLALESARSGVTVNAVCPGFTDTDLTADAVANIVAKTGKSAAEATAALTERNPQRRLVRPEEVADAVRWLVLPGSAAVTGQAIAVAGGEVM